MANKVPEKKSISDWGDKSREGWPVWARGLVSGCLIFHIMAVLGGAVGGSTPSSDLQQGWHQKFLPYFDLVDQGYPYRYYAPEPPPTPVVEATLRFGDGRRNEVVRLPDRSARPLLRYQRQLALAYHLDHDYKQAKAQTGDGSQSRYAQSYARHLCKSRPGCLGVKLTVRDHRVPPLVRAIEALESRGRERFDPDAEEYYDTPERIGDFPCDGF